MHRIIIVIAATLLMLLAGCSTAPVVPILPIIEAQYEAAHRASRSGFITAERSPGMHKVIEIALRVHVVDSMRQSDWPDAAAYGSPIIGYARPGGDIWVEGRMTNYMGDRKIIIDPAVLGHELWHQLTFEDPEFLNPDKLMEAP